VLSQCHSSALLLDERAVMSHNIVSGPPVASFSGSVDPLTEDVDNSSTPRGSSQPIPIAGGAKKHRGLQVCHVCRTHLPHTYLMPLFGGTRLPSLLKCAPPGARGEAARGSSPDKSSVSLEAGSSRSLPDAVSV
jgi:hypothetical protein